MAQFHSNVKNKIQVNLQETVNAFSDFFGDMFLRQVIESVKIQQAQIANWEFWNRLF